MTQWERARYTQRYGDPLARGGAEEQPSGGDWLLPLVVAALIAVMVTSAAIRFTEPRDIILTEVPAEIARLAPGETLWDLARVYAPNQDPRAWIERVKAVNGWPNVPQLEPGEPFIVTSWAHPGSRPAAR